MIKKLCIIASHYPSKTDPVYTFLGVVVEQFADMGIECHVITPLSHIEKKHPAKDRIEFSSMGNQIYVHCPKFIVVPNRKIGRFFTTYSVTVRSRRMAVWRAYRRFVKDCDAVYSHFLESGNDAAWLKKKTGKPAFLACGESNLRRNELVYTWYRGNIYNGFDGIVYVSSAIRKDAEKLDVFSGETSTTVLPNGISSDIFHKYDRAECREKLYVAENAFVVGFVGSYIKRKGFDKLQKIIADHPKWKCILIGTGELPLEVPETQIVYAGKAEHDMIPQLISAADVFVLPTLEEGCCNAIIEALACGLPVVSSNRPFNDDILDDSCSIRIDPENTDEIAAAIERLENDKALREKMSERALSRASGMDVKNRTQRILQFMEECIGNESKID